MKLFNVGFGNYIVLDKVMGVFSIDSAPIRRLIHVAKEKNSLIDATCGRKTQSVVVMITGHIVLSAVSCDTRSLKIAKECG